MDKKPKPTIRGYARVSTSRQDLDIQLEALHKAGCKPIYEEKISGIKADKFEFNKMMREAKEGDIIVVYAISRMSRSLKQLISILEEIKDKKLELKSVTEPIDTTSPTGKAFFHMLGVFAELEREMIIQRVREGSRLARDEGKGGGRKPMLDDKQIIRLKELHKKGDISIKDLCSMFGIGQTALYKYLNK